MEDPYRVILWEDKISKNLDGKITHHPLNGRYKFSDGSDYPSYGYLSFCGHDMDKSPLLKNLHVFYLEFSGEKDRDREAWADNLRAMVLEKMCENKYSWYIGVIEGDSDKISNILRINQHNFGNDKSKSSLIDFAVVDSEKIYGNGIGFIKKVFFEIPCQLIGKVIMEYLPDATPGWPIEGYCMDSGRLNFLQNWNNSTRDDRLCISVFEFVHIAFYTFPEEHRHFVFLANNMRYREVEELCDLKQLRRQAKEITESKRS